MSLAALAAGALRRADPETAHNLALRALALGLGPRSPRDEARLCVRLAGLELPNPIGLAAGFDKGALVPDALLRAGFGFVECGTVTPRPQAGNPRPRLFRLTEDGAVINRMGFNNHGLDAFAARLAARERRGVVGANLGANKDSADRVSDYVAGVLRLDGLCDYFTINISSPNTPGLRDLQSGEALNRLLGEVLSARRSKAPLFLKIAPDLDEGQIADVVGSVLKHGADGLVVTNTTLDRPATLKSPARIEAGGLSGAPLFERSTQVLRQVRRLAPDLPLIGVGGVASAADVMAKLAAGAQAVQLYSALALQGPDLVGRIKRDLAAAWTPDRPARGVSHPVQAEG